MPTKFLTRHLVPIYNLPQESCSNDISTKATRSVNSIIFLIIAFILICSCTINKVTGFSFHEIKSSRPNNSAACSHLKDLKNTKNLISSFFNLPHRKIFSILPNRMVHRTIAHVIVHPSLMFFLVHKLSRLEKDNVIN